jgi:hypothetical protein
MKTIEQRRLEILNWEKDNRNSNNRSVSDESGLCVYSGAIGCAVGRLVSDKTLCYKMDNLDDSSFYHVFSLLPEDVRELGKDFLSVVQEFHDTKVYWNENGLTSRGMENYDYIKKNYCS